MKRRFLPLLLSLCLLCSFSPAASAVDEEFHSVTALCVAEPGQSVFLDSKEFQLLCRQATGHDLESVTLSPLPAGVGTLSHRGQKIAPDTIYYLHDSPQLSQVSFTPHSHLSSQFTGQAELPFTLTSDENEVVSGTLLFYVPEESDGNSSKPDLREGKTIVKAEEPVDLDSLFPFHTSYKDGGTICGNSKVTSLTFDLPSSAQGALWLDYGYSGARKLLPEEALFPNEDPNLYGVTFVPAGKDISQVQLNYTVSLDREKTMTGAIILSFGKSEEPSQSPPSAPDPLPAIVSTFTAPSSLSSALYTACGSRSRGSLKTVTFDTLPTAGEGTIQSDGAPVIPGTAYPYETLSFLPGQAFQGGITLRYVGVDSMGLSFSGTLSLSLDYPHGARFQDLDGWRWATYAAEFLDLRRAVLYDGDDPSFRPGEPATRMELIYALVQTAYSAAEKVPAPAFPDLPADEDQSNAAAVAAAHGLVLGDGENRLNPDGQVTRQDALVMVYRALADQRELPSITGDLSVFSDAGDLASYAKEAAETLYAKGVLRGNGSGKLDPLSPITRAEMACLLYRAFGG